MNISVTLTPELRLGQALKQAGVKDPTTVSRLTVAGTLTTYDFKYIRKKMAETLQELDMGDALVKSGRIGFKAFSNCTGLTSVIIPQSVVRIDNWIFYDCTGLTTISVHIDNPVYASENGVLFNKDKTELIKYPQARQGCFIIPDSVTKTADYAFDHCDKLTSVVIPDSVSEIGWTLSGCDIMVHPDNPVYASENGVLFNKDKTVLISFPHSWKGDYVIPDSVVEIGVHAFCECNGLRTVVIPNSVTWINHFTFFRCFNLNIMIPESVTEIGGDAFIDCDCLSITVHPNNPVYESVNGKLKLNVKKN